MNTEEIARIVGDQRTYFKTHATFDVDARRRALVRLRDAVRAHEGDIAHALKTDLGKSHDEAYMCEIGTSLSEIRHQIAHVARWSRPRLRPCDLANAVSVCKTQAVPYGVTLIMAPWNYPFLLTLEPLAGALAAGNTVVIKPSAYAPASSAVLRQICEKAFDPRLVTVVEGGRAENEALLDECWDKIFFTGSVPVGKLVMERASKNLTPVTLELGGKSPCIVDATANLKVAARRIAFGKWLNVGQTCVAPDYLLVDMRVHGELLGLIKEEVRRMFGEHPLDNEDYGHIVNAKHFARVRGLLGPAKVVLGGAGLGMCGRLLSSGIRILSRCNYTTNRYNLIIVAISLGVGMTPTLSHDFFSKLPAVLQPLLHSGIMLATLSAVVLNVFFNGYQHHADLVKESDSDKDLKVRTVRMWLLMRKLKKNEHGE